MPKKSKTPRIAVYPGTFDPVTFGHLDVIARGSHLFEKLIVAVLHNPDKTTLFTADERVAMLEAHTREFSNVGVRHFDGLTVKFARQNHARILLRGLRTVSDFDYEFQMAFTNRSFAPEIETVFVMASENYSFLSSRVIKEALLAGGTVSQFVPKAVEKALRRKLNLP